jgi:N-acetylmuramoyl-L-alanine amidase
MAIIGLDDGHGTETSGKQTPDGFKENLFNDCVKQELIKELQFNGFGIVDCSPDRSDNSLQDRVNREKSGHCDIFVSIHYNAMGGNWQDYAGGIESYYCGGSSQSQNLAQCIHSELIKGTPLKDRGVKSDLTLYSTGLYVLQKTFSPAVLVECGFMDNTREAELMKSPQYRVECAKEICQGICKYFKVPYKNKDQQVKPDIIYTVQVGAFNVKSNAEALQAELKSKGYSGYIKEVRT